MHIYALGKGYWRQKLYRKCANNTIQPRLRRTSTTSKDDKIMCVSFSPQRPRGELVKFPQTRERWTSCCILIRVPEIFKNSAVPRLRETPSVSWINETVVVRVNSEKKRDRLERVLCKLTGEKKYLTLPYFLCDISRDLQLSSVRNVILCLWQLWFFNFRIVTFSRDENAFEANYEPRKKNVYFENIVIVKFL